MKKEYKPYVTIGIIVVNIIVFVILEILGSSLDTGFMLNCGAMYPENIKAGEYYRFLTSTFLHFGFLHIVNNMFVLGASGVILEEALGHVKFLSLYILSGIGAGILSYAMMIKSDDYAVSAGASGAIFGIVAGLLWVVIKHNGKYKTLTGRGVLFMIVLIVYLGVTTEGTDNWGHIGGLITGFLLCVILYRKPSNKELQESKNIDFTYENQYTDSNE